MKETKEGDEGREEGRKEEGVVLVHVSSQHTALQHTALQHTAHTKGRISLLSCPLLLPHLFQEVVDHLAASDDPLSVKVNLHPFTKTTRVVVPHLKGRERERERGRGREGEREREGWGGG